MCVENRLVVSFDDDAAAMIVDDGTIVIILPCFMLISFNDKDDEEEITCLLLSIRTDTLDDDDDDDGDDRLVSKGLSTSNNVNASILVSSISILSTDPSTNRILSTTFFAVLLLLSALSAFVFVSVLSVMLPSPPPPRINN